VKRREKAGGSDNLFKPCEKTVEIGLGGEKEKDTETMETVERGEGG